MAGPPSGPVTKENGGSMNTISSASSSFSIQRSGAKRVAADHPGATFQTERLQVGRERGQSRAFFFHEGDGPGAPAAGFQPEAARTCEEVGHRRVDHAFAQDVEHGLALLAEGRAGRKTGRRDQTPATKPAANDAKSTGRAAGHVFSVSFHRAGSSPSARSDQLGLRRRRPCGFRSSCVFARPAQAYGEIVVKSTKQHAR